MNIEISSHIVELLVRTENKYFAVTLSYDPEFKVWSASSNASGCFRSSKREAIEDLIDSYETLIPELKQYLENTNGEI